jgi:hypothetical protein
MLKPLENGMRVDTMPRSPFDIWDELPLVDIGKLFRALFFISIITFALFGIVGG